MERIYISKEDHWKFYFKKNEMNKCIVWLKQNTLWKYQLFLQRNDIESKNLSPLILKWILQNFPETLHRYL